MIICVSSLLQIDSISLIKLIAQKREIPINLFYYFFFQEMENRVKSQLS